MHLEVNIVVHFEHSVIEPVNLVAVIVDIFNFHFFLFWFGHHHFVFVHNFIFFVCSPGGLLIFVVGHRHFLFVTISAFFVVLWHNFDAVWMF